MDKFMPNRKIKENTEKRNVSGLRRSLVSIILSDRTFSTNDFENTLEYINGCGINIYENFDNGELLSKKTNPKEDDFGEAVYSLKDNFCRERIEDVKRLSKILYGKSRSVRTATGGSISSKKSQGHQNTKKKQESNTGLIVAGVVTVAAIAVIVGLAIKTLNK